MTDDKDAATDDPNTIVDSNVRATTPLHEAVSAAVERTQPDSSADDGDNDADSGDDVTESSAGDDSKDDDSTKSAPITVANVFSQYASTRDARVDAEQFTPKRFDSPGGNATHPNAFGERLSGLNSRHDATSDVVQPDDAVRIVGGSSASIDARQEQAALQAISDRRTAHGGGGVDLTTEIAAYNAVVAPLIGVRAVMPVTVPLMPLARTPTPVE
jgi:hypothetical protein